MLLAAQNTYYDSIWIQKIQGKPTEFLEQYDSCEQTSCQCMHMFCSLVASVDLCFASAWAAHMEQKVGNVLCCVWPWLPCRSVAKTCSGASTWEFCHSPHANSVIEYVIKALHLPQGRGLMTAVASAKELLINRCSAAADSTGHVWTWHWWGDSSFLGKHDICKHKQQRRQ